MADSFLGKLFRRLKSRRYSDLDWLMPPRDVHDREAWDRHWNNQASHGLGPPIFDMFCNDEALVRVMRARNMRTVLCAGNGISQEPRALAEAGFDVTAVDFSGAALRLAQEWRFSSGDLSHFFPLELRQPGGDVRFVVGDILDPTVCPGPFSVIVERCTLQLFSPDERGRALDALASRLEPDGILVTHCHSGGWRPGQELVHPVESLLLEQGWRTERSREPLQVQGRMAWLSQSTG